MAVKVFHPQALAAEPPSLRVAPAGWFERLWALGYAEHGPDVSGRIVFEEARVTMNTLESLFEDFSYALSILAAVAVFIGFLGGAFEFLAGFGK